MEDQEPPFSAEERPVFPFSILWPGYGNSTVTLCDLASLEQELSGLNDLAQLEPEIPFVARERIQAIADAFDLDDNHAHELWLICAYYLAPKQWKAFGRGPKASRELLLRGMHAANQLDQVLDALPVKVIAALFHIRRTVPDLQDPSGPYLFELHREVSDFAKVARIVATDLARLEGRPRYHERDTMFRLLLEQVGKVGLLDLKISDGTISRPGPHLSGRAGTLILEIVELVEPWWTEQWIAPRLKSVRTKLRKARAAGAKTSQT